LGSPKARDHWEDLGVDGRITLRWTLGRQSSMGLTDNIKMDLRELVINGANWKLDSAGSG